MCASAPSILEIFCCAAHVCRSLWLCGDSAALQPAGRIPETWTPCGKDMAITASNPSSPGTGHVSVGLWVLVNIIGRWCVKPVVLVRTLKATSQTKLKAQKPCRLRFHCKQGCWDGSGQDIQYFRLSWHVFIKSNGLSSCMDP